MRSIQFGLAAALCLVLTPAQAADRNALAELSTATWCVYCPDAEDALHRLEDEYDDNRFMSIAYHVNDEYSNGDSDARISFYRVTGTPTCVIGGDAKIVGGGPSNYSSYRSRIEADLATPSPIELKIEGSIIDGDANYTVRVLADANPGFVNPVLHVGLYESGIVDGVEPLTGIVRAMTDYTVSGINGAGATAAYTGSFAISDEWTSGSMGIVAFVQDNGAGNEVVQSARMFLTEQYFPTMLVTAETDEERVIYTGLSNHNSFELPVRAVMADLDPEEGWMGTFCIEEWGICLPDSHDFTMPADSTVTLKLQWIDLGAEEKTVTSKFLLRSGDNYSVTRGGTFTARAGKVMISNVALALDDDQIGGSFGNGDGYAQPGELIEFTTTAGNSSQLDAYQVTSNLVSVDPRVIVFEPKETYGDIVAGAEVVGTGGRLAVDENLEPGEYMLVQTFEDLENNVVSDTLYLSVKGVGIAGDSPSSPAPQRVALHQNSPNPFNPITTIAFQVPDAAAHAQLRVYDLGGREVRTLVDGVPGAGRHRVIWDGKDSRNLPVTSGVYVYRLTIGEETVTRRMLLVK